MSEAVYSKDLGDRIRELERRCNELERVGRLSRSSLKEGTLTILDSTNIARFLIGKLPDGSYGQRGIGADGTLRSQNDGDRLTFYDAAGNARLQLGKLPDGTYGIRALGTGNVQVFQLDADGWEVPYFPVPWGCNGPNLVSFLVNQATYAANTAANGECYGDPWIGGKWLSVPISYTISGVGNFTLRVSITPNGGAKRTVTSGVVTASGGGYLDGDISAELGQFARVELEAQRNSGAGTLTVNTAFTPTIRAHS